MKEDIIALIAEAEREASARKEAAERRAAEIVAAAEKRGMEIARGSEETLRRLREETLSSAEERASAEYNAALKKSRDEAAVYADAVLQDADNAVSEIVGRMTK